MKALYAITLMVPTASWAQTQLQLHSVKPEVPTVQQALNNAINPRFLNIPTGRFLYRHLRDTLGNHYASALPAGDWCLTVVGFASSRWLAVRWVAGSPQFAAGDTTTYYIPRAGARTVIHI
jgi:hypothetical protein